MDAPPTDRNTWLARYGAAGLLLLLGLAVRGVGYADFGAELVARHLTQPGDDYVQMLEHHFLPFLYYTHTKPPGIYLRDLLVYLLSGREGFAFGVFLSTSLLGLLSSLFLFGTLRLLRVPVVPAWLAAALWSIIVVRWEYWRLGGVYDHPTLGIMSFFLYTWTRLFFDGSHRAMAWATLAASLLVLFHASALLLVPLACGLVLFTRFRREWLRQGVRLADIPLLLLAMLVGKNFIHVGVATTSSVGGQNQLQFVVMDVNNLPNLNYVETLAAENRYPDWWRWCFNQARNQASPALAVDTASIYGICFPQEQGRPETAALRQLFRHDTELVALLEQDAADYRQRPWLFLGAVSESASRFAAHYGRISQKVWGDALGRDPTTFLLRALNGAELFLRHGPLYFSGRNPDEKPFLLSIILKLGMLARWIFYLGFLGAFLVAPALLLRRRRPTPDPPHRAVILAFMGTALLFAVMTLSFSTLTCCENNRIFVNFSPLPYVLGVVTGTWIWHTLKALIQPLLKS